MEKLEKMSYFYIFRPSDTTEGTGPMYQDPSTITYTPHPETGELYTDVNIGGKTRTTELVQSGPTYQVCSSGRMVPIK